jgi:hypothetical protein
MGWGRKLCGILDGKMENMIAGSDGSLCTPLQAVLGRGEHGALAMLLVPQIVDSFSFDSAERIQFWKVHFIV